ncbi:MAG: dihydropteroate synthase, partial [Chloroflexi bacterium]|nr:dihydropteroate synthase [Chloroflexota bacterium]
MPRARVLTLHTTDEVYQALQELGVAPDGVRVMARKGVQRLVLLTDISAVIANIVKQEMLARGGDAAVPAGAYELRDGVTQALLMGTLQQY